MYSLSNMLIQASVNRFGTDTVASWVVLGKVDGINWMILGALGIASMTFVGQNYGAGQIRRCRKTLYLCLIEDAVSLGATVALVLLAGHFLLAIFNNDPQVIEIGYSRLLILFGSYIFSLTYEILSGYLRGFGISLVPAILTLFGVCGVRIVWINTVFPLHHTFRSIMLVYPISLATTAVLIFIALLVYRPSRRFAAAHSKKNPQA